MSLALVRAPLQLPDPVLYPAVDSRVQRAAEAAEEDEKFEEGYVDETNE